MTRQIGLLTVYSQRVMHCLTDFIISHKRIEHVGLHLIVKICLMVMSFSVVPYADQFLCTNDKASQSLQKTALRLLSLVDFEFLDTSVSCFTLSFTNS